MGSLEKKTLINKIKKNVDTIPYRIPVSLKMSYKERANGEDQD